MLRQEPVGIAVIAATVGFLFVCAFDAPLQSVRLATLVYLFLMTGILMLEKSARRDYLTALRRTPALPRMTAAPVAMLGAARDRRSQAPF